MKPLRITDLAQLKLIGYCKPNKRSYKDQFLPACVKVSNNKSDFFQTRVLYIFSPFSQIGSLELQRKDIFYFENAYNGIFLA